MFIFICVWVSVYMLGENSLYVKPVRNQVSNMQAVQQLVLHLLINRSIDPEFEMFNLAH